MKTSSQRCHLESGRSSYSSGKRTCDIAVFQLTVVTSSQSFVSSLPECPIYSKENILALYSLPKKSQIWSMKVKGVLTGTGQQMARQGCM